MPTATSSSTHAPTRLSAATASSAGTSPPGWGTVYTFSVVRQNRMPGFQELGAYAVAYIDLDEGFRMLSTIVGVANPTTDIQIGQRVQVEFEPQAAEGAYPIPVFRPI